MLLQAKHKCFLFLLIVFLARELHADPCDSPSLELKSGYFFFADKKMRSVYDQGGFDIQLCGSFPLWRCFQLYTSLEYLQKEGYSVGNHQKTKIWQVPFTAGLKVCARLTEITNYYFTLGPRYFYVHMHNESSFVDRNLHKNGIGGFFGTGLTFAPVSHLIIDVFGEYSYERTRLHSTKTDVYTRNLQVGGFVFGGGLAYTF
jgi:hypothetical protein